MCARAGGGPGAGTGENPGVYCRSMSNVAFPEILVVGLLWSIPLVVLYVVVRLAGRHGIQDAQRRP